MILRIWDVRWKVLTLLVVIFSLSSLNSIAPLLTGALLSYMVLLLSGVSLSQFFSNLKTILILLLLMIPPLLLTPGEQRLWSWGVIELYRTGLVLSLQITIRVLAIYPLLTVLFKSSTHPRLMASLRVLGIPEKLVSILITTYRYIFYHREEVRKMETASRLRGSRRGSNIIHLQRSVHMLSALLIRSYEQSERVGASMVLRGYQGRSPVKEEFRTSWYDPLISLFFLLPTAAILYWEALC